MRVRPHLVLALLALSAALLVIAMFAYPGGRPGDPYTPGFDPFRNYFCDLISPRAHNGSDNTFGMLCARAGMIVTGFALLPLWLQFPLSLPPRAARLLRRCGWLTTLALPAVAWTPSGDWPHWHSLAILFAGVPGSTTLGIAAFTIWRRRDSNRGLFALTVALALVGASVSALWTLTFVASWPELALPTAQKLAWLLLLAWAWVLSAIAPCIHSDASRRPP
jgi:hypothetical protein